MLKQKLGILKKIIFQLDSGASVSLITQHTFEKLNKPPLIACNREIFGFGHKRIETLGELQTKMRCGGIEKSVKLIVAKVQNVHNLWC